MRLRSGRLPGRVLSLHRLTRLEMQDCLESKTTILAVPLPPSNSLISMFSSHYHLRPQLSGTTEKMKMKQVCGRNEIPAARLFGTGPWRLNPPTPRPPPAPGRHKRGRGSSWHPHGSSTERSSIMNTKSASDKGYHFQTPCSLTCTSALPFIIAFSLPFSLSPPLSGKI